MSRGPGKIERAIGEVFTSEPDDAFTVEDLLDRVLPGLNRIEKKHRVSVIRAAKNVCERTDGWSWSWSEAQGMPLVFWNRYDLTSYGLMRAKTDMFARYRSNDHRLCPSQIGTSQTMRATLAPGGRYHKHVVEGGAWWMHVQLWVADRDGDTSQRIVDLKAEQAR